MPFCFLFLLPAKTEERKEVGWKWEKPTLGRKGKEVRRKSCTEKEKKNLQKTH